MKTRRSTWIIARVALGVSFLYFGAIKTLDPVGFLKLVREFHVVETAPWLNAVAALLPWFEVACGVLLLAGLKPRATALLQLVLLGAFTGLVAARGIALYRAGAPSFCAIHFDCGCGNGDVFLCPKLLENVGLTFLAAYVAWGGRSDSRFKPSY